MKKRQILACLLVLGAAVVLIGLMRALKPEAETVELDKLLPVVEVLEVKTEDVELTLPTQGMIMPDKETKIASEVAGKVIWVSDKFKSGGEFAEGEEILKVDPADYESALAQAKATLADAQLNLETEKAMGEKAARDWKRLGNRGSATDLVLRKPQIASAEARIASAKAQIAKAERDLERTVVKAPYAARMKRIQTEIGSYLAPSAPVAELYAVSPFEVRLPLSLDDYAFAGKEPKAILKTEAGGAEFEWEAKVVRREGEIERSSRSVYLVAQVTPSENDKTILQPGLFVQAEVDGQTLQNVVRVPIGAFHEADQLVLVDVNNRLHFREVKVLRRQGDEAIVADGIEPGEQICLTPMDAVVDGMEVEIAGEEPEPEKKTEEEILSQTDT